MAKSKMKVEENADKFLTCRVAQSHMDKIEKLRIKYKLTKSDMVRRIIDEAK
ncbi:hypothetical protein KAI30_03310 [Candidatus Bathyarchaeota archaeon]|nr:hypothetical protein [Candidatus Bathyarchaeota archaeon]